MSSREFRDGRLCPLRHGSGRARPSGVALAAAFVLAASVAPCRGQQAWTAAGPEVIRNGQTEGLGGATPNPVVGGVRVVLPVPGEPDQVLLGAVNGGISRTTNLTNAAGPVWTSVTPNPTTTSHSIGAM